ncbi:DUF4192 family protein [Nocardia sp. ET3-3]|uniref:DUF4192 family protein n=1 Tax=Nocardia terrae TaxID=2675851 RepID=A0A7K1V1W2_9NOCA|nr:DUF4192 domain-containing protein [Nocardia terrae]MVU80623.1 DUF4192 family protein [Nocardia terrae]
MSSQVHIEGPGDLIADIPAMLGFVPERSLVVVTVKQPPGNGAHEVHSALRVDLPHRARGADIPLVSEIAHVCSGRDIVAALAVVVDDRVAPALCPGARAHRPHRDLVDALGRKLAEIGVVLTNAWGVTTIEYGAPWWNLDHPYVHGSLPDPNASMLAVRRVFEDACPLFRSRAELVDLVAADETLRELVAPVLAEAAADAQKRFVRAVRINNPDAYSRMALWRAIEVIKRSADGRTPAHTALAEVAVALRDLTVRDTMFGVTAGAYAVAAEQMWLTLTRALVGPDRADAAMLLAFSAYRRGDGILAGIALESALAANPEHRMAHLLDVGLRAAMAPDRLEKLVRHGVDSAAALRVDIGVVQPNTPMEVAK